MLGDKRKKEKSLELGFGSKNYQKTVRFLNKDGSVNIKRKSERRMDNIDFYHWLITTSWTNLLIVILSGYAITNTVFACVYYFMGFQNFGGILGYDGPARFLDLFFFSAQTLTTVGYGHVYPNATNVSTVAAIESMFGLLGFALATGVLYGRFSRPKAALLYSENVLLSPYENITGLMFRVANTKQNELIEVEASVVLSYSDPETNKRQFESLSLEINKINFLTLSWTIVHPIDEKSPIYNVNKEELVKRDAELIILIKAINDTYSQTVYSRMSYKAHEFEEFAKFVPIKQEVSQEGSISINLTDIHLFNKTL
ncbi:MAG TPA: ion channel [Bacteroidia bacterium]|jgi:inward rectifier potassium channel|nr:ion channel [Bacteroidia bacterium]